MARLREQGEAVHLVLKTTGCAGTCAGAAHSGWTGNRHPLQEQMTRPAMVGAEILCVAS